MGLAKNGIPRPRDPEKRWKPEPHVPSLVCSGVDARDKGVTEARPSGRRSPPFLAGLDSLVHDGLPGTHRETLFRDPKQWLPRLQSEGKPWVVRGLGPEP